jgi:MarR family transcriptional regulator, negative regulator of the multidrug operon emrRAB
MRRMSPIRLANLVGAVAVALADGQQREVTAVTGLVASDAAALNAIGQSPGLSIEAVRTILAISHPGAVRAIDRLAAKGLAERGAGVDGRTRGLRLTDPGGKVWERLNAARTAWLDGALGDLDRGQLAHLESAVGALLAAPTTSHDESEHICRLCDERARSQHRCPVTLAVERMS